MHDALSSQLLGQQKPDCHMTESHLQVVRGEGQAASILCGTMRSFSATVVLVVW
jgi:hypothetical protein